MGRFGFHAHRALSLPTEITNRAAHCCLLRSVVADGGWMADQGEGQQTLELLHAMLTTGLPIKPYFCQNCKKCSAAFKKKKHLKKSYLQNHLQKEEKSFLWDLARTPLFGLLNSALVVSQPLPLPEQLTGCSCCAQPGLDSSVSASSGDIMLPRVSAISC